MAGARSDTRSRIVAVLAYLYLGWVLAGIGREFRTADPPLRLLLLAIALVLAAAAALLPGVFAGRPGPSRWMRRLYLAGGIANLWIGHIEAVMLFLGGESVWIFDVGFYLTSGIVFLLGHRFLRSSGPEPPP